MKENMKQRYRVFRRGWGTYYCEDLETGKQETLKTRDKCSASDEMSLFRRRLSYYS